MNKIFIAIITALILCGIAQAQDKAATGFTPSSMYTLSWTLSVPIGDFSSFINNVSPAGGNFTGRYFLKKGFAVGFEFGWNNYYKKYARNTYYGSDGTAITAIHYNYAFIVPWKIGAYYYFMPTALACPYLGLSLGGDYMEEHILVQEYDIYNTQWGFTMSPEIGALIKFGRYSQWGANISAQYWFNTNSFNFTDVQTFATMQGLNFNVGVVYMLR